MDIEWAIKGETLYILQARPITTYFYIPESIQNQAFREKKPVLGF